VLFVQLGPEVLMRWSLTLTVVFVNRDPWEEDGAEDCVAEGLEDCIAEGLEDCVAERLEDCVAEGLVDGVPEGLPDCVPEVVAALHAVMDKGGLKGTPAPEHS